MPKQPLNKKRPRKKTSKYVNYYLVTHFLFETRWNVLE